MNAPANRKAKAAETEAALKTAAKRVFATRGYLNTKITDITAEAGRAAGSFYNHFAGKEELLESLLTDMFAEGDDSVYEDSSHSSDFADRSSVRWHVAVFWRFYRAHLPEMVALRQAAMVNPEFERRLRELLTADSDPMVEHLGHIPAAGIPLPGAPNLVVSAIHSVLDQFAYTWLAGSGDGSGEGVSDEDAIELLTDFIYRGVAGTPPRR